MRDQLAIRDSAACEVVRPAKSIRDALALKGHFTVEHWRQGKLLATYEAPNLVTNEGKNRLLNTMFYLAATAARYETWNLGLVDNDTPTPAPVAGDTYAQLKGTNVWDEWLNYDETTRLSWGQGVAAGQVITNASAVVFTISATGNVYGLFLCAGPNSGVKDDDTAGSSPNENVLWCCTGFASGAVAVLDDDQLKVTYTLSV